MRHTALISCSIFTLFVWRGCGSDEGERERAVSVSVSVHVDERAVLVGDVVERLEGQDYVYLRLLIVADSAQSPSQTRRAGPRLRWVALDGGDSALGQRIRVRSLGRRTRVWESSLERDFDVLDYVVLDF